MQVQFEAGGTYRSGDYWLIPARIATGGIDWPDNSDGTSLHPPQGVLHRYAPLGFIGWSSDGAVDITDCRCRLQPAAECPGAVAGRVNVAVDRDESAVAADRKKVRRGSAAKP